MLDIVQGQQSLEYVESYAYQHGEPTTNSVMDSHFQVLCVPPPPPMMVQRQPTPVLHAPVPTLQFNPRLDQRLSYPLPDELVNQSTLYEPSMGTYTTNAPEHSLPEAPLPDVHWMSSQQPVEHRDPFGNPTFPTPSELLVELGGEHGTLVGQMQQDLQGSCAPSPVATEAYSTSPGPSEAGSSRDSFSDRLRGRSMSRVSSRASSILPDAPQNKCVQFLSPL